MKHRTLLKVIEEIHHNNPFMAKSLTAIIKLHEPYTEFYEEKCLCRECTAISSTQEPYPCPTIQAIEAELK